MFMGSTVEWIDYPALLNPYNESSYKGVQALTQRMTSYIDGCEKAKVVLMGYSQGPSLRPTYHVLTDNPVKAPTSSEMSCAAVAETLSWDQ